MEYFNSLPEEITLDILSRLPTEAVLECKLVCTNWRSVVRRSSFSKMHLDHLNHPASDSGSGHGWRNLGKFTFGNEGQFGKGVFVNGALHWLDYQLKKMVTFDLSKEKFCKHISPPLPPDDDFDGTYQLGVLDGCLSFAIYRRVDGGFFWDVRLLKKKDNNHGMKEREGHQSLCWGEEFRVYDNGLFAVTKSGDVVTYRGHHINIHNLEALTSKVIVDVKEYFRVVFPHKNTLVSLKELGEEDSKIMESVETEETD